MGFDNECILNIHSVAAEYFCPVCRTLVYPNEALQTPCTHLYCKQCLVHIACTTQSCPSDGHLVTEAGSKLLIETNKAMAETIGKIGVCCVYHRSGCLWQGNLSECLEHRSVCAFGRSLVLCTICGIQIMHSQAEEHAQNCNVNVMNRQPQALPPQTYPCSLGLAPGLGPMHVELQPYVQPVPQAQTELHPLKQVPGQSEHQSQFQGQLPAQFAQPITHLRPLEPPQWLPPPAKQHTNSHGQPGFPALHQPVIRLIQPPVPQPHVPEQFTYGGGPPQQMHQPPFAPCSPPMLPRGPNNFANHGRSFQPQYPWLQRQYSQNQGQSPSYGPPGFVSSSASEPFYEQVRAPIGNHPDTLTKSTHPRLDEPGFRSSYTCEGFPNADPFCAGGGSSSFDNMRKRKSASTGWCHICKVDCESVDGLQMHGQTFYHRRMAMDMVNDIKQKSARMAKTSNAHCGLWETSKSGSKP